ncbi:hypothetical protein GCK32_020646 [Trichostrongylus colubriformis]|uniref:Uncharacterized protein n=1 Tax=Trichostrongylus colubriformis TaxID=6319 RepID=A0AAN8IB40_TRICO
MQAMYARSKPTEILRPMAEEMARAIRTAFKDEVKENKWMDKTFKKKREKKLDQILSTKYKSALNKGHCL